MTSTQTTPSTRAAADVVKHAPSAGQALVTRPPGITIPVSVVILTFNEEVNILDCMRSCAWCDDVHVLDSGSTDQTAEIAKAMGATIHVHKFKSFGDQRNWAIDNIPCKHPWHFHLDADERFTPGLLKEMAIRLGPDGTKSECAAYQCPSKMMLMGKWLKWSGGYPSYQVRLFKYGACRFTDFGHGQREDTAGKVGVLDVPYMHYNFSKGLLEWLNKHNDYSSREAGEAMLIRAGGKPRVGQLVFGEGTARRRAWKNMSYFMRGRAVWRFLYNYVFRFGLLDGTAGFRYCAMISSYEYWTELKIDERAEPWGPPTARLVETMLREPAR